MALYKCGYCGRKNEGDIWCSEEHRQLWYQSRKVDPVPSVVARPRRLGPQGRATGGRRRATQARRKRS